MHWEWHSDRIGADVSVTRWGEYGTPVLVFPPMAGDAIDLERNGIIDALGLLLDDGRIKVYSVDDTPGRVWANGTDPLGSASAQNRFNAVIIDEVVPLIREDCHSSDVELVTVGCGLGAIHAVTTMCRIPHVVAGAIGLSGNYDLGPILDGAWSDDVYFVSPIHFVPGMPDDDHMDRLRSRFAILASGTGSGERPGDTWWLADVLGGRRIPNRVDAWPGWQHGWSTWREMLPGYIHELVP